MVYISQTFLKCVRSGQLVAVMKIRLLHSIVQSYNTNVAANQYLTKILEKIFIFIGINFFEQRHTVVTIQMFFTIFLSHSVVVSFIFMLFSDVPFSAKIEGFCITCIVYQGLHKLYTIIIFSKYYYTVFKVIRDLHNKYVNDLAVASTFKVICVWCTILLEIIGISYYCVTWAYVVLPIFTWKNYGMLTTIFPMPLPFIDWHSPAGYIINLITHLLSMNLGAIGLIAADIMFLYFVLHTIGYLEIFKCRVAQLDALIESVPQDLHNIQKQLHECIEAHQNYISYIELIDKRYSQLCMSQLVSSEVILTFSLFLTLWSKWIVGPFMAFAALFQLLEYCILGTVVTVQNEKVSEIIYGMKWYLLMATQQKLVLLMILRAQSPAELNVGGFAKLNVQTCMQVLKTTYSYLMMMMEFIG